MSADLPRATMPYIGLRPFQRTDADLFFGREDQVEELLDRLESHRFLAVVGTSGCGKSSLVRAGLIPDLENGFMAEAGEDWQVATLLPGNAPLRNLAEALVASGALGDRNTAEGAADSVAAGLRRGPLGLVELFDEVSLSEGTNLLIIVDQFEEIFRFRRLGDAAEAAAFINLLLTAAASRRHPLYVVLTMRSDYLGDCAVFPDLPEALNDAQFLVPRLSRSQLETAITGPAALFDADVEEALLNRVLNELGSDPDQLPLMQHALMRMWTLPAEDLEEGQGRVLDLDAYRAIGGLEHALSNHVGEVSRELTFGRAPAERERLDLIVRVLFRCLCDITSGRDDIRRPAVLSEIAGVADVDPSDVIRAVEAFRTPTCSFIMHPAGPPHTDDTVLDIAHESLIRNWDDLRDWRADEARWKEEYDRLVQSAQRWAEGKAVLSVPPELDAQLTWRRTETIGPAWAARYGPVEDYDLAVRYLDASATAHKTREDRRRRGRLLLRLSIAVTTLTLIGALIIVWTSRNDALKAQQDAEEAQQSAEILRASEMKTHKELKRSMLVQNRTVASLEASEEALLANKATLMDSKRLLEEKNAALQVTESNLLKTQNDLERKFRESEEDKKKLASRTAAALTNLRLAKAQMLAAEAAVSAAGPGRDLTHAALLALRARLELGVEDHASNRILELAHKTLLPIHFVRDATSHVTESHGLVDGGQLLVIDDDHAELLDATGRSLVVLGGVDAALEEHARSLSAREKRSSDFFDPIPDEARSWIQVSVSPDLQVAVTLSVLGELTLHRASGTSTKLRSGGIYAMTCRWNEDVLVTAGEGGRLTLWKLSTGEPDQEHQIRGYDRWGTSPVHHHGLTAWADVHGNVHVWDWAQRRELGLAPVGTYVESARFTGTGDGRLLWVTGADGSFRGWVVDRTPPMRVVENQPAPIPEDEPIAPGGEVHRQLLAKAGTDTGMVSPDGTRLAYLSAAFRILIGDPETGHTRRLGVAESLHPGSFSGDSRYFASAGSGTGIRVWDIDGKPMGFLRVRNPIQWLGFTDGGTAIRYASEDKVWEWAWMAPPPDALKLSVCSRLTRHHLDPGELRALLGEDATKVTLCPKLPLVPPRARDAGPGAGSSAPGGGPPPGPRGGR